MKQSQTEPRLVTYLHGKARREGFPVAGNFELTARCNFNCPMCYVHQTQEQIRAGGKRELTGEQWLSLARQARNRGMVFALLTGGEPLVREDFFEIYGGMKALGLMVSVNSNGSLLQGENLARFLEDPPFRFNISLYGGSNETYRTMCGVGAYDRVRENIRALRAAGVNVSLNLSITPYNCGDLEQIYRDAEELDVNVKASSYMYPPVRINGGEYGGGNRLTAQEAAECAVRWDRLRFTPEEFAARAEAMRLRVGEALTDCPGEAENGIRCRAGSSSFWVTWDGTMLPCGMMTEPAVRPLETGFDAAWETLREATAQIRTPGACAACENREICGVCPAVCYGETGSYQGQPHYVCEKTRAQFALTQKIAGERKSQ